MTGLTSILLTGLSALRASQTGLGVASQNVANANTPGYVRTEVSFAPRTDLGPGAGVEVAGIARAADRFLATAVYIAEATRGAASARADILARAQSSFGDPLSDTSMFSQLDQFWAALTGISVDPSSSLRRDDVVSALQSTYAEVRNVSASIQSLIGEADQRIGDAVAEAQSLINRIAALNDEIRLTKRTDADTSAAENAQSALVDELAVLIDVRVSPLEEGGVHVRTSGGALLVGVEAAKLSYKPNTAAFATHSVVQFNPELGTQSNLEPFLLGGQIAGLLQARDQDLVGLAEALGGLAGSLGDALNQIHNENTSSPAVSSMTGRQTGLLASDAHNFTGVAIMAVTDAEGDLAHRFTIDFTNGVIHREPTQPDIAFGGSIGNLVTALNTALAGATPAGTATFTDGVLRLNIAGGNGGIVIQQDSPDPNIANDTATPSSRAGRGFAHFFGLNDLVTRPTPLFFENGVSGADLHGMTAGGEMVFRVKDANGRLIADRTITIAGALTGAGSTWNDLIGALNATGSGLGGYGTFALDAATGRISFTPAAGFEVELVSDSTARGGTGVSVSALHGMSGRATAGRALEADVNLEIASDSIRLAVGRPNIFTDIGDRLIEAGDNRGAAALAAARDAPRSFAAAGALTAQNTTLALYVARVGGEAGRLASDAQRAAKGAAAVSTAAVDRRAQIEGVNLDDELMRMTTYQNAYAAAARVIQATTEMFDVLLSIGYRR